MQAYTEYESAVYFRSSSKNVYESTGSTTGQGSRYTGTLYVSRTTGGTYVSVDTYSGNLYNAGSSVNTRGTTSYYRATSEPSVTLYIRDSSQDRTIYRRKSSPYDGTLYYRDTSKDVSRYIVTGDLTFNLATVSTQQVNVLTY